MGSHTCAHREHALSGIYAYMCAHVHMCMCLCMHVTTIKGEKEAKHESERKRVVMCLFLGRKRMGK